MKKILIALLVALLIVILVAAGYVAYLFIDYHRLDDVQTLEVRSGANGAFKTDEEKTIVTFNIGFGAYDTDFSFFLDGGKESRARSREACENNVRTSLEVLKAQNADLVLMQEVDVQGTRSRNVNQRAMAEETFAGYDAVFAQNYDSGYLMFPIWEPIGAAKSGILTFSNVPIESALRRRLPIESGIRKFFDLDRCYSVSRIPVENGKTLCLYNLHLSAYTSDGSIATEQLALLLQDMQTEVQAGNYVIAGGDFNKDVWGHSADYTGIEGEDASWCKPFPTELLPENISLVNSLNEDAPVLSCRDTGSPYQKGVNFEVTLDGFLVSDNVEVTGCEVIDAGFKSSDHNPVKMTFALRA